MQIDLFHGNNICTLTVIMRFYVRSTAGGEPAETLWLLRR